MDLAEGPFSTVKVHYLPLQLVIRKDKATVKLHIAYHASVKTILHVLVPAEDHAMGDRIAVSRRYPECVRYQPDYVT